VTVVAAVVFRYTWGAQYYGAVERAVLVPAMTWVSLAALWSWPIMRNGSTASQS
jgi:hypothetical protein